MPTKVPHIGQQSDPHPKFLWGNSALPMPLLPPSHELYVSLLCKEQITITSIFLERSCANEMCTPLKGEVVKLTSTEQYDWVHNPFTSSAEESVKELSLKAQEEFIDLRSNHSLKLKFSKEFLRINLWLNWSAYLCIKELGRSARVAWLTENKSRGHIIFFNTFQFDLNIFTTGYLGDFIIIRPQLIHYH
ncbi:unnamed protein product [Darwinula stevensoni]|uniref:Uncharacterized protein n=1 Tax=Darwinula stevensoni TaxID=69355 RepID=A0A7R9A308_9CRUS|nr:unnamed protein product [Darwinula stevensoni]CAG0881098.1 unnamed protein product [Darwinula stevensoni]